GPDRIPDPADGARQPDLAAATRLASRRLGSRDAAGARPTEDRHVASTRLIPVALRAAPGVTLALLVGWATLDVYAIGEPRWSAALFTVLSVVVPILAADLAVAGIVPTTTIPTAIALAGALVAVVALLALLPSLKRPAV